MRWLFDTARRLKRSHAVTFCLVSFLLGQFVNYLSPLKNFHIYQLLFTTAIVIAGGEMKAFALGIDRYRRMTASHPIRGSGVYAIKLLESNSPIPAVIAIGSLFIYATVSLEFIQINLVGCFAIVAIAIVMLTAVVGQTCYVYYILILRRILSGEKFKYSFYFPAKTDWLQEIARIGTRLSNAFFILGFIYTTVFYLNMPAGYIRVSIRPWHLSINTPNNTAFIASWVTIFVIIIFAFPTYAWIRSAYVSAIVEKLKSISATEIESLMRKENIRDKSDADMELKFHQLITVISDSPSSPSRKHNLLPIAATLSSIAVHLITIFDSLS